MSVVDRPTPGSHDPAVPSGSLEQSAAALFEAMLAARDAEGSGDAEALRAFYRAVLSGTLLLPVPPGRDAEARQALRDALSDEEEVEIEVMLAREGDGETVSVCFGSVAALSAWAPAGTGSLPLPGRIVIANLAAAGLPAVLDPAGPVPYRFEAAELAELAAGGSPVGGAASSLPATGTSLVLRLPGGGAEAIERDLAARLEPTDVEAAYLVESVTDGRPRLLLGLVGAHGAEAEVDVPDGTDVVWLEGPLLANVRAVTAPFFRRARR